MENSTRFVTEQAIGLPAEVALGTGSVRPETGYRRLAAQTVKRSFDIVLALAAMPVLLVLCLALVALNPFWNPGPLFYRQDRMGLNGSRFAMIKFRSMRPERKARDPEAALEKDRITQLGLILRTARIDEWPQFLNVLRGDMSLVGPRPDCWSHAVYFTGTVPGYAERHRVRPGITGLAQVSMGYAEGLDATCAKVRLDLNYIRLFRLTLDGWVLWRTLIVVFSGAGR